MRISECLHNAVMIGGKKVVLVIDYVGQDPVHFPVASLLVNASDKHPALWVNEADVAGVRETHGDGVQVYGIWQTLIANNLLNYSSPSIIRLTPFTGLYFDGNGSSASTGEYVANMIPAMPGSKLSSLEDLNVQIEDLVLPIKHACLSSEVYDSHYKRIRRAWIMRGASVISILLIAAGVDLMLTEMHENKISELSFSSEQAKQVLSDLSHLKVKKMESYPNQFTVVARYAAIAAVDKNFKFKEGFEGDFREDNIHVLVGENHINNPMLRYFSVSRRNDGLAELTWVGDN